MLPFFDSSRQLRTMREKIRSLPIFNQCQTTVRVKPKYEEWRWWRSCFWFRSCRSLALSPMSTRRSLVSSRYHRHTSLHPRRHFFGTVVCMPDSANWIFGHTICIRVYFFTKLTPCLTSSVYSGIIYITYYWYNAMTQQYIPYLHDAMAILYLYYAMIWDAILDLPHSTVGQSDVLRYA